MKVLIYSHDSFGLGHLRRCRSIAHALVEAYSDLSVLILSGSPIIGSFDFKARVDFVRIPGVIKLRNGQYTSLALHIDISETLAMRSSIIKHTAEIFNPDFFLVDKEPLGLRGEVHDTLKMLKEKNTPMILGVRDILDAPEILSEEWERKNALYALENFYDDIWVYGLEQIINPFQGIDISSDIKKKISYTGYLKTPYGENFRSEQINPSDEKPYILVTPGGGGDGEILIETILKYYESDYPKKDPALIVLGPFMSPQARQAFVERASRLEDWVKMITFDSHFEDLIRNAKSVVSMGGYNTFCDILTFDKPCLILPRKVPRLEQYMRAMQFKKLGLIEVLEEEKVNDISYVAKKMNDLEKRNKPSHQHIPNILNGLETTKELAKKWL